MTVLPEPASKSLRKTGLFLASVCVIGALLMFGYQLLDGHDVLSALLSGIVLVQVLVAGCCLASALQPRLLWLQPAVLLIICPLLLIMERDTFYGTICFVLAVLLLYKYQYLLDKPLPKLRVLLVYLALANLAAALARGDNLIRTAILLLIKLSFLATVYLLFKDFYKRWLGVTRPLLDLRLKGLSNNECRYVCDLHDGFSCRQIAAHHQVSESTVRNTLARAYRKLTVKDKEALLTMLTGYELQR
jgi:DNA-binding CsgD family transcriptional regulator